MKLPLSPLRTVLFPGMPLPLIPPSEKPQLLRAPTAAELLEQERSICRREVSLLRAMLHGSGTTPNSSFSLS